MWKQGATAVVLSEVYSQVQRSQLREAGVRRRRQLFVSYLNGLNVTRLLLTIFSVGAASNHLPKGASANMALTPSPLPGTLGSQTCYLRPIERRSTAAQRLQLLTFTPTRFFIPPVGKRQSFKGKSPVKNVN